MKLLEIVRDTLKEEQRNVEFYLLSREYVKKRFREVMRELVDDESIPVDTILEKARYFEKILAEKLRLAEDHMHIMSAMEDLLIELEDEYEPPRRDEVDKIERTKAIEK